MNHQTQQYQAQVFQALTYLMAAFLFSGTIRLSDKALFGGGPEYIMPQLPAFKFDLALLPEPEAMELGEIFAEMKSLNEGIQRAINSRAHIVEMMSAIQPAYTKAGTTPQLYLRAVRDAKREIRSVGYRYYPAMEYLGVLNVAETLAHDLPKAKEYLGEVLQYLGRTAYAREVYEEGALVRIEVLDAERRKRVGKLLRGREEEEL